MRKLLILTLLAAGCAQSSSSPPVVLSATDSIGWSHKSGYTRFIDRLHLLNFNAGHTQKHIDEVVPLVLELQPDIIYMNAGIHDANLNVSPQTYLANLTYLFDIYGSQNIEILWCQTTFHENHPIKNDLITQYNALALQLCEERGIRVFDPNDFELIYEDGLHFTTESMEFLSTYVEEFIYQ